jgi:hypothetical protein
VGVTETEWGLLVGLEGHGELCIDNEHLSSIEPDVTASFSGRPDVYRLVVGEVHVIIQPGSGLLDLGAYVGIVTYAEAIEVVAGAGKDMRLGHDVDHVSQLIDVQFDALHGDDPPWRRFGMLMRHVHGYDRTRVPYSEDDGDRMDVLVIGGTEERALAVDDVAVVRDAAVILDFQSAFAQATRVDRFEHGMRLHLHEGTLAIRFGDCP